MTCQTQEFEYRFQQACKHPPKSWLSSNCHVSDFSNPSAAPAIYVWNSSCAVIQILAAVESGLSI